MTRTTKQEHSKSITKEYASRRRYYDDDDYDDDMMMMVMMMVMIGFVSVGVYSHEV